MMRFMLGVVAGVFLTLTVYKGWPYVIRFDDLPEMPVDWAERRRHWTNGVEDGQSGKD